MSAQDALTAITSIPREANEPVFAEPWEARAFAIAVALNEAGVFSWSQWAQALGANLEREAHLASQRPYFDIWWQTLEELSERHGLATDLERAERAIQWQAAAARTPHGEPIEL